MAVEVDILVADDEPADLLVVGDDGIGQPGTRVGPRQAAGREQEMGRHVGRCPCPGVLRIVNGQRLVHGFDVDGRPGGAAGVGGTYPPLWLKLRPA